MTATEAWPSQSATFLMSMSGWSCKSRQPQVRRRSCQIRFSMPSGNPTIGAGLQEFRALFRQFDEAQSGTPKARLELWENGALVRAGSDANVPDGGLVISLTWDASEVATADDSAVEGMMIGTKVAGPPGARNSVEIGAVEWNVDYTPAAAGPRVGSLALMGIGR